MFSVKDPMDGMFIRSVATANGRGIEVWSKAKEEILYFHKLSGPSVELSSVLSKGYLQLSYSKCESVDQGINLTIHLYVGRA